MSIPSERKQPTQPVIVDQYGVHRFQENAVVSYLLDHGGIDLNKIAIAYQTGEGFPPEELIADYDPRGHGDPVNGSCWATTRETAERLGLMVSNGGTGYSPRPTPLGRKVAELLRPKPWRNDGADLCGPDGEREAECYTARLAERIADALTCEDVEAAKRYRMHASLKG